MRKEKKISMVPEERFQNWYIIFQHDEIHAIQIRNFLKKQEVLSLRT